MWPLKLGRIAHMEVHLQWPSAREQQVWLQNSEAAAHTEAPGTSWDLPTTHICMQGAAESDKVGKEVLLEQAEALEAVEGEAGQALLQLYALTVSHE